MNLFDVLKRDHCALLDLLRRAGRTSVRARAARTELLAKARTAFDALAEVKEAEFLPALRSECTAGEKSGDESIEWRLFGSADELAQARRLFDELRDTDPGDRRWIVRLSLLEEHVERHIAADQRELYPLAKRLGLPASTPAGVLRAAPEPPLPATWRAMRTRVASLWV